MIRTLTIPAFALPDQSNPEVAVRIALVDETGKRTMGINPDGNPIIDSVTLGLHQLPRTLDLWPNAELSPDTTRYRVTVGPSDSMTVVQSGPAELTWAEFVSGRLP